MRRITSLLIGLILVSTVPTLFAVDPVPESQQAALAQKILDAYHGTRPAVAPKKLHIVYFTPADRDPEPRYQERLDPIMEDIRSFYRDGMVRAGFGPETFDLDRDKAGKLIIHLVKGKEAENDYQKPDGQKLIDECRPVLKAAGISFEHETVLIFCNLAKWDDAASSFSHHSPYYGVSAGGVRDQTSGLCFAVDTVIQDLANVDKKGPSLLDDEYGDMSLGKFNTIFIGGIAHELGHALSLPHCGERWDEKPLGTSLMGVGNHTYREERRGEGQGSFLTMGSAMKLAGRPLFDKSIKGETQAPKLDKSDLDLSTNITSADLIGRPAALRLSGTVSGTPPVYGIIAYFDSVRDGGYHAPTATAVPDAEGHFAIEISDLKPTSNGQLRVQFCHANGGITEAAIPFIITPEKTVDLTQLELMSVLEPVVIAVNKDDLKAARLELAKLEKSIASNQAKTIAQKLVATLEAGSKLVPAEAPTNIAELPLGDARWKTATVGWLEPTANRIPPNNEVNWPLLDCGKYYATGLFAHAPSRYVYDLGGKWSRLRGEAGLHTAKQELGSVEFIIKADGKEVFHSSVLRKPGRVNYDLDLTGIETIELIVADGGDGISSDWGLWLDPILSR